MKFNCHNVENYTPESGTGWFKFANRFDITLYDMKGLIYWKNIPVGHASFGLCGGMVYAVKDYYEASKESSNFTIPQCETLRLNSKLGEFIKKRQVDSAYDKLWLTLN